MTKLDYDEKGPIQATQEIEKNGAPGSKVTGEKRPASRITNDYCAAARYRNDLVSRE